MGQSSNKPIHSNKNPPTQSELQLENVDERRRLVEIRSQDVSTNLFFLFVQIHEQTRNNQNCFTGSTGVILKSTVVNIWITLNE